MPTRQKLIGLTITFLLMGMVTAYAVESDNTSTDVVSTTAQTSVQNKTQCQKMMKNCPMAKKMTPEQRQLMMQKCQKKMNSMTSAQKKAMMQKCSKMKNMTPEQKQQMMAKCKKMMKKKCKMTPSQKKKMMGNCPMMGGEKASTPDVTTGATQK